MTAFGAFVTFLRTVIVVTKLSQQLQEALNILRLFMVLVIALGVWFICLSTKSAVSPFPI